MKFTKSKDGVDRADVRVTVRLSVEDIADLTEMANKEGKTWRQLLEDAVELGIHTQLNSEHDGSYEQHHGRGGD